MQSEEYDKIILDSIHLANHKYLACACLTLLGPIFACYFYVAFLTQPAKSLGYVPMIAVGVTYLAICLINFKHALYILIFFVPLQFRGLSTNYGVLSVTDVMLVELFFVWLIKKLFKRTSIAISSNTRYLFIWLIFLLLSLINTIDLKNSLEYFARLLSSITLFFIIYDQIRNKQQLSDLLKILVFSSFIVSLYGVIEYFVLKGDMPLLINGQLNNFKRVETFFHQPNETAAYLVMTIPFVIYFIIKETRKSIKCLYFIVFAVSLSCLTVTFSRAGWLCSALSVIFLPLKKRVKILLIGITICLLLTALSFMLTTRQKSVQRRLYRYKMAATQVLNKPFLGHGFGTYQKLHRLQKYNLPPEQEGKSAHSLYVNILVEIGIVGFVFFLLFLVSTAKKTITSVTKLKSLKMEYRHVKIFNQCLLSSFMALFLTKFFETGLTKLSMWIMLAIINTCPRVFLREENEKTEYTAQF